MQKVRFFFPFWGLFLFFFFGGGWWMGGWQVAGEGSTHLYHLSQCCLLK
uniref:Uncharacterized protein n=1 Tax=Rhizophora mucronata TaxID=61149 RepID=A0A2P2NXH4_RHIMU